MKWIKLPEPSGFARRCFRALPPLLLAVTAAMPAAAVDPKPGPFVWTTVDGRKIDAVYGVVEVPEDRGGQSSNTLKLAYVRLPSTASQPGPPIVYLAGGPGAS